MLPAENTTLTPRSVSIFVATFTGSLRIENCVRREAAVDDAYAVLVLSAIEQIIESRENIQKCRIAGAQSEQPSAGCDAAKLSRRTCTACRDHAADERSVSADEIGVRKILDRERIIESRRYALQIVESHVLNNASRQIRMLSVDAGVEHRDRTLRPVTGKPPLSFRRSASPATRCTPVVLKYGSELNSAFDCRRSIGPSAVAKPR